MASCQIEVEQNNLAALFGQLDHNMQLVSRELQVVITQRDGGIHISGSGNNVLLAQKVVENLLLILQKNGLLDEQSIQYCLDLALAGSKEMPPILEDDVICLTTKGRPVKAKTLGQKKYIQAIRDNSVVFGIGPAGTGKTYLAVAMAVRAFKAGEVEKIILTRPAVEAGEKLGFLPGDLQNKVDPYLRPLYDALYDMLGAESFLRYQERGSIEVAPLAYMRGRTLNDSFIILDEAQNTTAEQMKIEIGCVYPQEEDASIDVKGRCLVTGLPKTITVHSSEMLEAFEEPVERILEAIHSVLERTPPELVGDISNNGIVMTGGGSLVKGFAQLVEARTGIHTQVADDAISCVAQGTGKSLDSLNDMQDGTVNLSRRRQMN